MALAQPPLRAARPVRRLPTLTRDPASVPWSTLIISAGCVAVGVYVVHAFWSATRVDIDAEGITKEMVLTPRAVAERTVSFTVNPSNRASRARLRLDGAKIPDEALDVFGATITWRPGRLAEGTHKVSLVVPRPAMPDAAFSWRVVVDNTPPRLDVPTMLPPADLCAPVTVLGQVEKGSSLTVDGKPMAHKGTFTLRYQRPPLEPLKLVATDLAGNQSRAEVVVPVRYPGGQGVHVTAAAWAYEPLRLGILGLIDAHLVSAIQLDLKDEDGIVGFDSKVPLAVASGAVQPEYRLRDALADLKSRGVRVIGRIVAFRDPQLAQWAWANGKRDWVIQTPEGAPLPGGFTNHSNPEVRRYNLDIALEASAIGVDDIMWDYMRRPEGDPEKMVIPGLQGTSSQSVVDFLALSHAALRERCVYQGATVFGIAADRPNAVGQDVPRIARHVEYISPMLYPSHWTNGEYGVKNPNAQPYDIVKATLADFQKKTAGTGTYLVPWLQDFTLGYPYGANEVRAQIDASNQLGVSDWMLWNAGASYTVGALQTSLVGTRS